VPFADFNALVLPEGKEYEADFDMLPEDLGAIPIDFTATDPIEAVKGKDETPAVVLNQLVHAVRATGRLGVVGLYVPSEPGAPNEDAAEGKLLFEIGTFFEKGQPMGTGQADVKSYNRQLRDLIIAGKAEPGLMIGLSVTCLVLVFGPLTGAAVTRPAPGPG